MPSEVVFTRSFARGRTSLIPSQASGCTFGPNCAASASARARVRLARWTRLKPRSSRPNTTAREEPPAPSTSASSRLVPAGRAGVEIAEKAFDIGIGRAQLAVGKPQRVGGAHGLGARIGRRQRQHAFLVRDGDIGADKTAQRQPQHEIAQIIGRNGLDDIAACDAERAQPIMMDQRRARMRGRPSDQTGCGRFGRGRPSLGSCFEGDPFRVPQALSSGEG